jgi:hypothetical protein
MRKDWFGSALAAPISVLFAFAFGLFAGPSMRPGVMALWIGAGFAVTVFTWWSTARASKESREARELQEDIKDKLIDPLGKEG